MSHLHTIFDQSKEFIGRFMGIIQPVIDEAQDDHTRLYYHHILEEEEQRLGRLEQLIPYLASLAIDKTMEQLSDRELSHLLSDINLERFGLHNFREHLELALYKFQEESIRQMLDSMREATQNDYLRVKEIMTALSERFSDVYKGAVEDHDDGHDIHQVDHLQASVSSHAAVQPTNKFTASGMQTSPNKGFTVGSLRNVQ